jgi:thiamine-phosphate pyrophosphorylase
VTLPRLYVVLDAVVAGHAGWSLPDLAEACLAGGARLLQIRAKDLPSGASLELACRVADLARRAKATLIVNDRADIAKLSGADGVHVGQDDLTPSMARTLVGPTALVGVSTHLERQVRTACEQSVDYIAIGPVFETRTKATGHEPGGLELVRRARRLMRPGAAPLVAIGGITLETAPDVIRSGAAAVAVIRDIVATRDPEARVRSFVDRLLTV